MTDIIVPKGLKATHSFDLWGPVVDAAKLGQRKIDAYKETAKRYKIDPEESAKAIQGYEALLEGASWATGGKKVDIINALEGPLEKYNVPLDYNGVFQQDGMDTMCDILNNNERVIVFSSKTADWLKRELPSEISDRMGEIYGADKSKTSSFKDLQSKELNQYKGCLVSHTADELPELVVALKSGVIDSAGLIYVNRNNSNTIKDVLDAGIGNYLNDLKVKDYKAIATQTE